MPRGCGHDELGGLAGMAVNRADTRCNLRDAAEGSLPTHAWQGAGAASELRVADSMGGDRIESELAALPYGARTAS